MEGLPECIDLEFEEEVGNLYRTGRGELLLVNTLSDLGRNGYTAAIGTRVRTTLWETYSCTGPWRGHWATFRQIQALLGFV